MKGVILAAGLGGRLNPMTKYINKHLLPIYDRPMIDICLEKLHEVEVHDIAIISDERSIPQIQEHLGTNAYTYIQQDYSKGMGLAKAILHAEDFVGTDNFIVHLGDQFYEGTLQKFKDKFEENFYDARLLLKETGEQARNHTVVNTTGDTIDSVVEKPDVNHGKTMIGIYAFTPKVFDYLRAVEPSERGEYELADAVREMVKDRRVGFDNFYKTWIDTGTHENVYKATQIAREQRLRSGLI